MNELTIILQKEQEQKEKIETTQKEAETAISQTKVQLEKQFENISLSKEVLQEIKKEQEKKLHVLEKAYEEKTAKALVDLEKIKKEKIAQAVDYLLAKILCLK